MLRLPASGRSIRTSPRTCLLSVTSAGATGIACRYHMRPGLLVCRRCITGPACWSCGNRRGWRTDRCNAVADGDAWRQQCV